MPGQELRKIIDERQIERVLLHYCRAIDRIDMQLLSSCYWPEATDHHGGFTGSAAEFVIWVESLLRRHTMTMHQLSNVLIDVDGDRASSESYAVAYHRGPINDARWNFTAGCRYVDRFERRDGEWRIIDRVTIIEWTAPLEPADPVRDGKFGPYLARRDRADPIYSAG